MRDVRTEINRINEIVSFPPVIAEILQSMTAQNVAVRKITELIESDQALTAKILHISNSPFYGLSSNIHSVASALTLLGLDEIGHLLLTIQMKARLSALNAKQHYAVKKLWKHSVTTAAISRLIAHRYRFRTEGKEYTAGLMHDMGKLVLIQYFPEQYALIESMMHDASAEDYDAEMLIVAISHMEIGYQLGQKWRLPKEYLDAMQYHHSIRMAPQHMELIAVVRLADLLSELWGSGIGERVDLNSIQQDECIRVLGECAPEFMSIPVDQIVEELFAEYEKTIEVVESLS